MDDLNLPTPIKTRRPRRSFSKEDKMRILDEANQTSFADAARENEISPSLLFQWRKNLRGAFGFARVDSDRTPDLENTINRIERMEALETVICQKLITDLESGHLNVYNAATGFASIVNAAGKLVQLRLEVEDRLGPVNEIGTTAGSEYQPTLPEELEAERMLLEIIRQRLAEKKTSAARTETGWPSAEK